MFICIYIVDQNRPQPKELLFKKLNHKIETAVFAIKIDRNRTGKLKPHRPNNNNDNSSNNNDDSSNNNNKIIIRKIIIRKIIIIIIINKNNI